MCTLNCETGSEFQSSKYCSANKEKRKEKGTYQLVQKVSEKNSRKISNRIQIKHDKKLEDNFKTVIKHIQLMLHWMLEDWFHAYLKCSEFLSCRTHSQHSAENTIG